MLDPVVCFFLLGALAGLVRSDLKVPLAFYNTLSIYLLLSIGIKGGIELYKADFSQIFFPALVTVFLGIIITSLAFFILSRILNFNRANAAAIAAHYGTVSAVTFAVVNSYLHDLNFEYEEFMTVLLVFLEIPGIATAIFIYKTGNNKTEKTQWGKLFHEIMFGKSMLLLIGGLFIGMITAFTGNKQLNFFFFDLFKGFLSIFMLEMGIVASARFADLRKVGIRLVGFGILMPILSASLGVFAGLLCGLSEGGTVILATMAASASYIAAPAAMKMAVPEANSTYYLTAALGVTFPFNLVIGIPLYVKLTHLVFSNFQ